MNLLIKIICVFSAINFSFADSQNFKITNDKFVFDIFNKLNHDHENIVISPYSIATALALASVGAEGKTYEELVNVLNLNSQKAVIAQNLELNSNDKLEFKVANSLWLKQGLILKPRFSELLPSLVKNNLFKTDFYHEPEESRQKINLWVQQKTNNKIIDLIPSDPNIKFTEAVLVNAVHFLANWESPFKAQSTMEASFFNLENKLLKTKFMNQISTFRYAEDLDSKMLEILYAGKQYAMYILLPKTKLDLSLKLNQAKVDLLIKELKDELIYISIPKFKTEYTREVKDDLRKLGIVSAFDANKSDFSSLVDQKLFISKVIHKALINVDEKGTEAAAATALTFEAGSARLDPPISFVADHPFVYFIKDLNSSEIIFIGAYYNP